MTIEKGQAWGEPAPLPPDGVISRSDAEAGAAVATARREGRDIPVIGLVRGDLCRTLGGTGDVGRLRSTDAMMFPIDVGSVLLDGRHHWFVAHLVARTRAWGRIWAALNAQWLGELNLAPRGHPDDGLLDTFDAHLGPRELLKVRARARHGAHLPHPAIGERKVAAIEVSFERPRRVWLDGVEMPAVRHLSVRVEPDAARVVI